MNKPYIVNASINKVSITSQIELGSFIVTARNSQEIFALAMKDENIDLQCIFTRGSSSSSDNFITGKEYESDAVGVFAVSQSITEVECELPTIADGHPTDNLTLSLRVSQLAIFDKHPINPYLIESADNLSLELVPVPVIARVEPQNVFNMLHFKTVTIHGTGFIQSMQDDLLCIFTIKNRQVKVPANFVHEGLVKCATKLALAKKRDTASIFV